VVDWPANAIRMDAIVGGTVGNGLPGTVIRSVFGPGTISFISPRNAGGGRSVWRVPVPAGLTEGDRRADRISPFYCNVH